MSLATTAFVRDCRLNEDHQLNLGKNGFNLRTDFTDVYMQRTC